MLSGKKKNNKHKQQVKVFTGYEWGKGVIATTDAQAKKIKAEKKKPGNLGSSESINPKVHADGSLKKSRIIKSRGKKCPKGETIAKKGKNK